MNLSAMAHAYLVSLICGAVLAFDKKWNLDLDPQHVMGVLAFGLVLILKKWHLTQLAMKLGVLKSGSTDGPGVSGKAAASFLLPLFLLLGGCAWTPGEIQAGTSLAVGSGLTLASIAVPQEKDRIATDARTVATAVNQLIPTFFPGATSAALLNSSVDTAMSILKAKLASSPHGPMIAELIAAARVPFASVLGGTSSPAAAMSPTTRADALAFFTAISTAISQFLNDPSLMPPKPPDPAQAAVPK